MELTVIIFLIILNGLFAMSEIALVSSKKVRLEEMAKHKNKGAAAALKLLNDPEKFLSTVQVGITLIGIIAGAYGGVALSEDFQPFIERLGVAEQYASRISFLLVVGLITYLSIVIGELVPKTIAYNNPESVAAKVAPLMWVLSYISKPVVSFLSISTRSLLWILRIKERKESPVTEEELKILIEQGTKHGILEVRETEMIKNIFRFGDRKAYSLMTNRQDIVWLDIDETHDNVRRLMTENNFSVYPVCNGSIDNIAGIIRVKDYMRTIENDKLPDIRSILTQPLYIPENLPAIKVVEKFRTSKVYTAIVINEYGSTEGMITLHNLIENIFGDLPGDSAEAGDVPVYIREDGSMLIDGSIPIDELRDILDMDFETNDYTTLGGFIMFKLRKIPSAGDNFLDTGYRFEVVDMDGKRVDKVLVQKQEA